MIDELFKDSCSGAIDEFHAPYEHLHDINWLRTPYPTDHSLPKAILSPPVPFSGLGTPNLPSSD